MPPENVTDSVAVVVTIAVLSGNIGPHGVIRPRLRKEVHEPDNPLAKKLLATDLFAPERRGKPRYHSRVLRRAGPAGDRELLHPHDAIRGMTFEQASYSLDPSIADVIAAVRDVGPAPAAD